MNLKAKLAPYLLPIARIYWRIVRPKTFGVKVVLLHPTIPENVLLVLHSYGSATLWNLPGGGYSPKRETPENAAKREVQEELGIEVADLRTLGSYVTQAEGKHDTVAIVIGTIPVPELIRPNEEIKEISWTNISIAQQQSNVARVARYGISLIKTYLGI